FGRRRDLRDQRLETGDRVVEVESDAVVAPVEGPLEAMAKIALGERRQALAQFVDDAGLATCATAGRLAVGFLVRQGVGLRLAALAVVAGIPLTRLDGVAHPVDVTHKPG